MKARDVLGDEFVDDLLGPLEGKVEEGDLVFRPALRAAVGPTFLALLALAAVFIPVFVGALLGASSSNDIELDNGPAFLGVLLLIANNVEWLFALAPALAPVINVLTTRYVLANDGIRERKQFLNKEERKVAWDKVTALKHRRTVIDRILGIERLDVIAYGERGVTLHLVGLPDARPLRSHVAMRMRQSASVDALLRAD